MKKIQVLFPEPQMQRLKRAARAEDRPISEIIRRATDDYLSRRPTSPQKSAEAAIPVFDGGKTLIKPEAFRNAAYSDRTGATR